MSRIICVSLGILLLAASAAVAGEGRLPEPAKEAQAEAEKAVKEVYGDLYAKKTPDDQTMLALKLLATGSTSKDDPKTQYVLFREAREAAIRGGDVATAMAAIEQTAAVFDVDAADLRMKTLAAMRTAARTPEANKNIAEAALRMVDAAIAADDYDAAARLADTAAACARASGDAALSGQAQARVQDITRIQAAYVAVKVAMYNLTKNPNDADGKFKVGQFYCFYKDDRATGLKYLSDGSNPVWARLAKMELASPADAADMAKLADGYYEQIGNETGMAREKLKEWAAVWYAKALPKLTGLTKAATEKRLKELTPAAPATTVATPATPTPAALTGATVTLNLRQPLSERTRKALPSDTEQKRLDTLSASKDLNRQREASALARSISYRLVADGQNWTEVDMIARLEAQSKLNKHAGYGPQYIPEAFFESLNDYINAAKTVEQFALKFLALYKASETIKTPTEHSIDTHMLRPALSSFTARNANFFATKETKAQFCDWLKKQGLTSKVIDEYKDSLK
jgi:hypothetical protein